MFNRDFLLCNKPDMVCFTSRSTNGHNFAKRTHTHTSLVSRLPHMNKQTRKVRGRNKATQRQRQREREGEAERERGREREREGEAERERERETETERERERERDQL